MKCRDFVNLRCWQLCRDGRVIEGVDLHPTVPQLTPVTEESNEDNDDGAESDVECILQKSSPKITKSCSEFKIENEHGDNSSEQTMKTAFATLSKSLGAQDFQNAGCGANSDPEDVFSDALSEHHDRSKESEQLSQGRKRDEKVTGTNVYVSAAVSIHYPDAPITTKYIRYV